METPDELYKQLVDKIKEYLCENARPGDLVLTMGAGDVWKVGELFLGTEK